MCQIAINVIFAQALVAAQRAELQLQATELEWHRNQTKAMAASQRDRHSVAVANATARFEAILREQVKLLTESVLRESIKDSIMTRGH